MTREMRVSARMESHSGSASRRGDTPCLKTRVQEDSLRCSPKIEDSPYATRSARVGVAKTKMNANRLGQPRIPEPVCCVARRTVLLSFTGGGGDRRASPRPASNYPLPPAVKCRALARFASRAPFATLERNPARLVDMQPPLVCAECRTSICSDGACTSSAAESPETTPQNDRSTPDNVRPWQRRCCARAIPWQR